MQTFTHAKITSITWYPHKDPNLLFNQTYKKLEYPVLFVFYSPSYWVWHARHYWLLNIYIYELKSSESECRVMVTVHRTHPRPPPHRQRRGHSDSERRSQCQLGRGYEWSNTVSYGATLIMSLLTMEVNFMWHECEKEDNFKLIIQVDRWKLTVIEN